MCVVHLSVDPGPGPGSLLLSFVGRCVGSRARGVARREADLSWRPVAGSPDVGPMCSSARGTGTGTAAARLNPEGVGRIRSRALPRPGRDRPVPPAIDDAEEGPGT